MYRIALCDDDPGFQVRVEKQLKQYAARSDIGRGFEYEFRYFSTAAELLQTKFEYHILFLDIVLEGGSNGIDVGIELRRRGIDAVFILLSSMDRFQEGYYANVLRYLKKPIDPVDFAEAMNAALHEYRVPRKRFAIKVKSGSVYVAIGDIIMAESRYRKRVLYVGGTPHATTESWDELCVRLPEERFFSPQKTIRINFGHVAFVSSTGVTMSNGRIINFSRATGGMYQQFDDKFQKFLGG